MGRAQTLGREGEDAAVAYLERAGMRIVERNWRCPIGEIDVVAVDGACLVVCEVKTRRSTTAGAPVEAVTPVKLARLRRLAGAWLAAHDGRFRSIRIDVVAVSWPAGGPAVIDHLRGVV